MNPSQSVRATIQSAVNRQQNRVLEKQRNFQRVIRNSNRYTTYHAYRKNGNKNWQNFKQSAQK